MNVRNPLSTAIASITRSVPRVCLAIPAAVALGLTLLPTCRVVGQEQIRIVESPRTAMRETRPLTAPPRQPVAASRGATAELPPDGRYEEHYVTEMQDQYRTVYVPVIENQTEPTRAWWNPLGLSARPFLPRPVVRWETRVEKTRVPVRYRELAPESTQLPPTARTSTSPIRSETRFGATGGNPLGSRTLRAATRNRNVVLPDSQFGGISQMESDQPRFSTRQGTDIVR